MKTTGPDLDSRKEVRVGDTIYPNYRHTLETLDELFTTLKARITSAESEGFTDVSVTISSTVDPYEDNVPGPVEIEVWGLRDLNEEEKADVVKVARIYALAGELGVSYYEASVVDRLKGEGKI